MPRSGSSRTAHQREDASRCSPTRKLTRFELTGLPVTWRSMKMSGSGQRCAGFTLMEVLVALLILGLAFGVLLPSFSFGLNSVDRTRFHVLALSEARSQIDRIGSEVP